MPPRDPPLPEGTDQIIDTNVDSAPPAGSAAGGGASGGSPTGTGTPIMTDTTSGAAGDSSAFQFDEGRSATGGTAGSASGTAGAGDTAGKTSGVGKAADTIVSQLKEQVGTLRSTAGERARSYAADGKQQATSLLTTIAEIIQDAAGSVETKLGSQYSGLGNRAADSVNALARTLDERDIDDLVADARDFVRRSPAVAIGVAAVIGFAVARVVRSGVSELTGDTGTSGTVGTSTGGSGKATTTGSGGSGATSGGLGDQGAGTGGGTGSSAPKN